MDVLPVDFGSPLNLSAPFEREIGELLESLRAALAALIEGITPPVRRPSEFQRTLRLDKSLGWSLFTAATTQDISQLASLIPGKHAMSRVFKAAKEHGVAERLVQRAREQFERFEQAVQRHAEDREAFEAMVADTAPNGREASTAIDARHRRTAFRTNVLIWGRQARVTVATGIVHPSKQPGLLDVGLIAGMIDLRQTRIGFPLHTHVSLRTRPDAGDPTHQVPAERLDPRESDPDAVGLLRDFCSQPLPEFTVLSNQEGKVFHHLVARGLGATSAMTFYTGHVLRACMVPPGSVPESKLMLEKTILVPTELFIRDVFMHRSVWDDRPPEAKVYAYALDGSLDCRDIDLLPFAESASHLGSGTSAARTPEIPRYAEMLGYAMERLGWNPDDFRLFRTRVLHPVMYSRICVTFRKPEAGN
jgi:hypothetical protein